MKIGNLTLKGPLFLAPLAGITTRPFRVLATEFGADCVYTEMISIDALFRDQKKTMDMIDLDKREHPVGVQLFGSNPEYMAHAVKRIAEFKPDLIDINLGCPVLKVVKKNGGAALLKDLPLAEELIRSAVENSDLPVTIKIRSGWSAEEDVYIDLGQRAERAGAKAVTLHPRSRTQGYSVKADWSKIAKLKRELSIPVIGNGDIETAEDAIRMIDETGCDGIMVARAAMKDLYILKQIKHLLKTGEKLPDQTLPEKIELALLHAKTTIGFFGDELGCRMIRKHLAWYTKGLPQGGPLRNALMQIGSFKEAESILNGYLRDSDSE